MNSILSTEFLSDFFPENMGEIKVKYSETQLCAIIRIVVLETPDIHLK